MRTDSELFTELQQIADRKFGGHFTVMKFTTNWRVSFGTPMERSDIASMSVGKTFAEAADQAIRLNASTWSAGE
jgi:hypothetical protein